MIEGRKGQDIKEGKEVSKEGKEKQKLLAKCN